MDLIETISIASVVLSFLWLSYAALNLYKGGKPRELYGLYMNTAGMFYIVMVAAWVLMFLYVFSGGFMDAISMALVSLSFLLPFFIIIGIGAASMFLEKSTDKIGFLVVVGTFIWQLSAAISSTWGGAMFALGVGYFFVGMTMLIGGSFLGGLLGNFFPDSEKKMREWLQSSDSDDTYGQVNALWRWQAKNTPEQHAISVAQMKQSHFPSSQVVQIFIFSFWSIAYAVAMETIAKDPEFLATILKDPIPFIFGPFFGFIFLFFAFIIIYAILASRKSKKMELKLDKSSFAIGEKITGTVILKLDKPKQARGLRLEFYGVEHAGDSARVICQASVDLSPARLYQNGESVPFAIDVPAGAKRYISLPPTTSTLEKMSRINTRIAWNVKATLDLPEEIDLAQIADIKITDPNANLQEVAAVTAESKAIRQKLSIIPIVIFLIFAGFFIFQFISIATNGGATSSPVGPAQGSQANAHAMQTSEKIKPPPVQFVSGYKMQLQIPYGYDPPPMAATLPSKITLNSIIYQLKARKYISANPYNDSGYILTTWLVEVKTDNMTIPATRTIDVYMDLTVEDIAVYATNFRTEK